MLLVSAARIERSIADGLYQTQLVREESAEFFLTALPAAGEDLSQLLERVSRCVRAQEAWPVAMTVFAPAESSRAALASLAKLLGPVAWPITWLTPEDARPGQGMGVEVHAVRGMGVAPIRLHGRVVGSVWHDGRARHCELGDLRDAVTARTPAEQTQQVLSDIIAALGQAGMTFAHVYRTWFRNHDILGWYGDFNRVRTERYARLKVFDGLLPASTGIGADNPFGAALVAGLLAMDPVTPGVGAAMIESPLQDSPRKYGSAFSRAVEVNLGDHRRVTISGTASIAPAGATVHIGDVPAQVDLTMEVVEAILHARGMGWADVTRALAYFRRPADVGAYKRWEAGHGVGPLPTIVGTHTVCRDDLLYEIEVDAMSVR